MYSRVVSSAIRRGPRQWNRVVARYEARSVLPRSIQPQHYALSTSAPSEELPPSLSAIRTSILKSALKEVHPLGWTEEALAAATASVRGQHQNMSMSVVGIMTVDDLIAFCMDQWNVQLKEDLLKSQDDNTTPGRDPLESAIQTRLEYLIPYLQSNRWHEGMALGIRGPSNALQTQRQLQEMVDIIVAASPEHRASLGTPERMALGAVYVATELHLLTDNSPEYQDTWAFLNSRMKDWHSLTSLGGSGGKTSSDALFVASSVASSLMGGLLSLVTNPTQGGGPFGLPQAVWTSLFQTTSNGQGSWDGQAGTHRDDYKVPKRPQQSQAGTPEANK